jgi:hypothetical protein
MHIPPTYFERLVSVFIPFPYIQLHSALPLTSSVLVHYIHIFQIPVFAISNVHLSDVASPISPCGICRQFIREFCKITMPILLVPSDYSVKGTGLLERTLGELLPDSFGPEDLERPRE